MSLRPELDAVVFSVDECWLDGWRGPSVLAADESGIRIADREEAPDGHLAGTVMPGVRDAHAHLGLVERSALLDGGVAAIDDLGSPPEVLREASEDAHGPEVRFAGAFLTAVGGYPSDRTWAAEGSWVEVVDATDAERAVAEQVAAGASFVKVSLNAVGSPVLDDATLAAIVAAAHARELIVVAHVEGEGQAARALEANVDRLAHTPFTELLSDALVAAMARRQCWVSTIDIHGWGESTRERELALDNLARFAALGGRVRYGTDLGNGPLPLGVNERELHGLRRAGVDGDRLLGAAVPRAFGRRLSHTPVTDRGDAAAILLSTRVLDHTAIKELLT